MKILSTSFLFICMSFFNLTAVKAQVIDWANAPINPIAVRYTTNHHHLYGAIDTLQIKGLLYSLDRKIFSKDGMLISYQTSREEDYRYEKGKLSMMLSYSDTVFYRTDAAGNVISSYTRRGPLDKYTYNKNALLIQEKKYSGVNVKYSYDKENRLVRKENFNDKEELYQVEEMFYSSTASGRLKITTKRRTASATETVEQVAGSYFIRIYNIQGDEEQRNYTSDTSQFLNTRNVYDLNGNKVQEFSSGQLYYDARIKYYAVAQMPADTLGCRGGNCITGYGRLQYKDMVYEGFFNNGTRNGYGVMTYKEGNEHVGNWVNGQKEGYGSYNRADGKYISAVYANNQLDGMVEDYTGAQPKFAFYQKGKLIKEFSTQQNDSTNRCQYGDCKDGYGVYIFTDQSQYQGFFKNATKAMGLIKFINGDTYQGQFDDAGKYNGVGVYIFANGNKYTGQWVGGKYAGTGIFYDKKKNSYDVGWYGNGKMLYAL